MDSSRVRGALSPDREAGMAAVGIGYFVFAAIGQKLKLKYSTMSPSQVSRLQHFDFIDRISNFIFQGINIDSPDGLAAVVIIFAILAVLYEGSQVLLLYTQLKIRQHPLTYGRLEDTDSLGSSQINMSSMLIPSSEVKIKIRRLKYLVVSCFLRMLSLFIGYVIMLAVMTFNAWIMIAVLIGVGIGYFVFAAIGQKLKLKYSTMSPSQVSRVRSQLREPVIT